MFITLLNWLLLSKKYASCNQCLLYANSKDGKTRLPIHVCNGRMYMTVDNGRTRTQRYIILQIIAMPDRNYIWYK